MWAQDHRNFTIGMVLLVTLVAFEAMGLATALPTMVHELHGEAWYSWPFTVFLAASVIATVLAGRVADRRGPAAPVMAGLAVFVLGLLVAGLADDMPTLLVARALQGLASGSQSVGLLVLIAVVYPKEVQPAAFGAISSAWVVPALIGPTVAGLVTQYVTWRWLFLGLAPLVALGAVLVAPTVWRCAARAGSAPGGRGLTPAAVGAACGVVAVSWAVQNPSPLSVGLGAAAIVVAAASLRVLLPVGTLRGRPGLPVVVLARGLLAGTFFGAQSLVPLLLSAVHHYSPATAGLPLTVGSLGWTAGAVWQARKRELSREKLILAGLLLVATAVAGLVLVAPSWGPHWLVFLLWGVGGVGMGMGVASTSTRVLALSPAAERGFNSAALQISDMLGQAALVGLGGGFVAVLGSTRAPTPGVVPFAVFLAVLAVVGASLVFRSSRTTALRSGGLPAASAPAKPANTGHGESAPT